MKMKNEVKIAIAAIFGIGLLIFGINYLKGVNILTASNTYYVKFQNAQQLAVGNQVYANGYSVGTISNLAFNYENNSEVVAAIELDDKLRLPKGTKAELVSPLMGGVVLNLILGPNPIDVLNPRDTIIGGPHLGALDKAGDLMPSIEAMLPKLDSILANVNTLTSGNGELQQTLANAAVLSGNLVRTTQALDALMANQVPNMLNNFSSFSNNLAKVDADGTVQNLNGAVTSLNTTLTDAQQVMAELQSTLAAVQQKINGTNGTAGALLNDRELYDRLNRTVASADSLITDLKAHPKRYVNISVFGGKK